MGHYEIKYTSKWTGKQETHVNKNSEADAKGWAEYLAKENNCKAEAYRVDNENSRHIVSYGDKG